jgi:hypothetical protein
MMKELVKSFYETEDGAVTVDFVVLTAAICTMGLVVGSSIANGAVNLANEVANEMIAMDR